MKKRLVSLIATAILTAGVLVGCGGGKYTDGTYTGEAQEQLRLKLMLKKVKFLLLK